MINLTHLFYELLNEGYIYEENEDGLNMSYGEYAAICDYALDEIKSSLSGIYDIIEFLEKAEKIIESADDDAKMFFGLTDDNSYIYIDYDNPVNSEIGDYIKDLMIDVNFDEYEKEVA